MIKILPTLNRIYLNISWENLPATGISEKDYTVHVLDQGGHDILDSKNLHFSYGMLQYLDISPLPKGVYTVELDGQSDKQKNEFLIP